MTRDTYVVKRVSEPHSIVVEVPGSKSITNRALLIAALADGESSLDRVLFSDDSRHFLQALKDLGFDLNVDEEHQKVSILGLGGKIPCVEKALEVIHNGHKVNGVVNVGSAGTAARFLAAFLGLSNGRFYMDSSEQMKKRPMKELMIALESLGASIEYLEEEFHFPFIIGNDGITGKSVKVDVDKSSQFLSALLISAPLLQPGFEIEVEGHHGLAYVEMTIAMMKAFGINVSSKASKYILGNELKYNSMHYDIEPDMSAACYFYAMTPILNVKSLVKGIHHDSLQGDIWFLSVLQEMGCFMEELSDGIELRPGEVFKGGEFDLSSFSDQTLTLASIAPFASSPVVIKGVGHIRHQECDRIEAILHNLTSMGIEVKEENGVITIYPGRVKGCDIETYEDHRVAMSFTLPGLVSEGFVINNPMCCSKTFEKYFDVLEDVVY